MADAGAVSAEDMKVPRLQRERDDVAGPCRDPVRRHRDQKMARAFASDMRLITEPLVGYDANAHVTSPDRDLLRPDPDPHAPALLQRLPRGLIEHVARNLEYDVRADRETEVAVAGRHLRLQQIHRRLADEACDEQIGRTILELPFARELLKHAVFHHGDAIGERA